MTDVQIETFLCVLHNHSFSRASEMMLVPQPTISHRVCQLEREIGAQLLTRSAKSIELTQAGEAFLPYAQNISEAFSGAKQKVEGLLRGSSGSLVIGCSQALMHNVMTYCIKGFLLDYPHVSCSMIARFSEDILNLLFADKIDVGIMNYRLNDKTLEFTPLFEDEVLPVASPTFAVRQPLRLADLQNERFLVFPSDRFFHTFLMQELHQRGITLTNPIEVESIEMIKAMVSDGMGITFLPRMYIAEELRHGELQVLPLESWTPLLRTTYICNRVSNRMPMLNIFKREMQQLSHTYLEENG